jgi:hypothetical protein
MTMRLERFAATLALACLCNCATTKPDSTDSPSSLIDLPEQQKQNEDNLTIGDEAGEAGETVSETGSQHNASSDGVPHDQSSKTVSGFAESGGNQAEDPSVLDQPDAHESKSTPSDSDLSSKPEATETTSTVDDSQSEASDPSAEGKHSFESENASDIDENPIDTDKSLAGNSNAEADVPLANFFTKDSISGSDSIDTDRGEGNPSGVNKTTKQTTIDQTDLKFSDSSEGPENKPSSPDVSLGFSAGDVSPPDEPDNSGNRLAYESENQPGSPYSTSPTSNLRFSDSNSESPGLEGVNSTSLFFSEPHAHGTNHGSNKSTSIHLGPQKDTPVTGPANSPRRYVGLSKWLSRSSSETSSRDEVYLGHSEPKVSVELESYIDESPLVGIEESVPWEYDSIAGLLRPRGGGSSDPSDEIGFDYESVRKFFGRNSSMGTTEANVNATPTAFRYDGVLHWLDRRDSASIPPKAKTPVARKYSNALNWIRNEGR